VTHPPAGYAPVATPRPARRRWPRRLLVTAVVLALVLVGLDRASVVVAQRIAGQTIQQSQHLPQRPDVDIIGFPFLTQLAAGHYGEIIVTVHGLRLGEGRLARPLQLAALTVHLHDVTVSRDFRSVSAARATADAHASYERLSTTIGTPISYGGPGDGGRVRTTGSIRLDGVSFRGTVSAAVRASSAGGVRFVDPRVSAGGRQVPALTGALEAIFSLTIPLDGLPFDIRVDSLDVNPDAVVLHLSGAQLHYSRG
jgi:hypothetical protein